VTSVIYLDVNTGAGCGINLTVFW